MPASPKRQARRKAHAEQSAKTDRPRMTAVEQVAEEINFQISPAGLMPPTLLRSPRRATGAPANRGALTPIPLETHQNVFMATYGGLEYTGTTNALWRALLREAFHMRKTAEAEERATGVPAMPEPGPLMTAVFAEMAIMAEEREEERETLKAMKAEGEIL